MSSRRTAIVSWRSLGWFGVFALLVLPMTLLIGATDRERARDVVQDETMVFERNTGVSEAELRVAEKSRVQLYARPEASWWPVAGGKGLKRYGDVSVSELDSPHTLHLPNGKGTINVRSRSFRHDLPAELKAVPGAPGVSKGKGRYFIVQLSPEAVAGKGSLQVREALKSRGMEVIRYIPNNGFLVRIASPKDLDSLKDAKSFQFVSEFAPADKIHPKVGLMKLRDPERAVSDIFDVVVQILPGEEPEEVAEAIRRVGGDVVQMHLDVAGENLISAKVRNTRLLDLAREPGVEQIFEALEYKEMAFTMSAMIEVGRLLEPRDFGDFVFPFRDAGIDGGGIYGGAVPNFANPNPGAAIPYDSSLGLFTVAPQFLGVADNGLTLDTASFAHDNTHPCTTGACGSGLGGVTGLGVTHRKVEAYTKGNDVNNDGTLNDATSTGDFLTCDSVRSGGNTHGTVMTGGAAANPSLGPLGLGRLIEDVDTIDQFVTFFNDSGEVDLPLDGQARGSRVIFQDIAVTPISAPPACAHNFLSDVDAGDVPAARLQDLAFRRDLNVANSTLHPRGAKVTLFAFGNPTNFDDNITNGQGNYSNGANTVDAFLFANRRVLHVMPAGNDGGDPTTGTDIDPFAQTDPNDVYDAQDIQINDLATAKNIVTVGSVTVDSLRATTDPSENATFFSGKGPATFASNRGAPTVMASGVDTGGGREGREGRYADDYFISGAQLVSFDNANDTAGVRAVEDVLIQGRAGTSISSSHVAGAALQIRDYFAKGFYPTASANAADRVSDMSGALVKALLINSADMIQLSSITSCGGRGPIVCPTESGYGKVELANTLPLNNYRAERRPPNRTNVAPTPNVPQGMLVADEYFDGGARGTGADGSTTGIGVVPVGGSVSFDFNRRHGNDQLRISLAWYDSTGESLNNDLDLTVTSGDYQLVDAGKGICNTLTVFGPPDPTPEFCGFCTYAANEPGSGGYYDATANNPFVYIWRGNQFRQFGGEFALHAECDPTTGVIDPNFVTFPQNETDSFNTTESVMLHYFGDPVIFGGTRSGADHGPYRARISFKNTLAATPVPNAPAIHAGANGVLDTAPAVDDTILTFANGQSYIGTGANGIANTTAAGGDVQLIPLGSFGQPFGLAIAGPVANNRVSSVISLDRIAYDCSERTLSMRVADNSLIPANVRQAETVANVNLRTKVQVLDQNSVVVDEEGGFSFTADTQFGGSALRVSRQNHYTSNARRLQFITNRPGANSPIFNNGIVEVSDGWTVKAIYDDQSPTSPGGPIPDDAVNSAKVKCAPILGPVLMGGGTLPNPIAAENVRRTVVAGGCDVGRAIAGRGDFFFDADETNTLSIGFANQNLAQSINLKATLSCADPVPGGANPCSFLTIITPAVEMGVIPPGREGIGMWTIKVDSGVKTLATADRAVDFQVTFNSRSTDFGGVLATQVFTFREALQADMEILRYNTDFPGGGTQAADYNRDGLIRTLVPGSGARNRELSTFQPLNNAGNSNADIAPNMPFRFDLNNGGFTAFRAADAKPGGPGSAQNSLAWFYSTGGGCGWQTQNNGVVSSSSTAPKGVWHAGHGPVGVFRVANACPEYTTPSDTFTVPNTEFILDMLDSPIFEKVNPGLDARGIPFDVRMEAMGWNENVEWMDNATSAIIEVDSNLDDSGPVILGEAYTYRPPFGSIGPMTNASNRQRTFGPLRDSDGSLVAKGGPNGEEVGVAEPIAQRIEINFLERPFMAFPVADVDGNVRGFQSNTAIDGVTGRPIIPGVCTSGVCTAGADTLIGQPCPGGTNAGCTGPGTRVGHTTPWGPVRNRELDFGGTFEDFNGASGNRFQFEFNWILGEGGQSGGFGWTVDDVYFEWSEQHPADQSNTSPNDCANIQNRPGANPAARQCGTVAFERLTLYNCTSGIKVLLTDSTAAGTAGTGGCSAGQVPVILRSNEEPLGETFCLAPKGGGAFEGTISTSSIADQKGILFVNANPGENFNILAAYRDPECDQDNDGELAENNFLDVDGDGVPNFGADAISKDISVSDFLAEGQGSSDDDNCFDALNLLDVFNPPGIPQRDNNNGGTVSSEDCPIVGAPNGRSPRNGQCDWDDDGFGDLCDNCPVNANNNQLDSDGDGIGNACEDNDIDRDGDTNAADNCPTLYNPSQAVSNPGDIRGSVCNNAIDVDGDGISEVNDNCPNFTGTLENGVPHPPFSTTYNPEQVDTDNDGVGDKCDSEDFDNDGVINIVDNCATVYNPPDPTFQIQTDSDLDGDGDDRLGIDIIPGAQDYCDPNSTDDNRSGSPDDLVQVASEIDCNHTQFGITNVSSTINALGSLAIFSIQLSDDGSADFICTAGDPNPANDPSLLEECPQENPTTPNNDAACDSPGSPGSGVCSQVPDGSADPGELSNVRLTLVNASVSRQNNAPRALTNLIVGMRPTTPSVKCVPRAQTFFGTLGAGATGTTAVGGLSFSIDPASPGPGRSSPVKLAEAEFALTALADDVEGIPDQKFKFFVDVDRTDFPPIAAACPQFPSLNGLGVLCEDFDTDRNGNSSFNFTRLAVSAFPGDPLRANSDQTDDVLGFTQGTAAGPIGTSGLSCARSIAIGLASCAGVVTEENDWHLHHSTDGPGAGYDPPGRPNIGAPTPKAHSGVRSMHMGRHTDPTTTLGDTTRFRQVSAFVLDTMGDPNIPGVVVGPNSQLDFWHMISVPDSENAGSGFIPSGVSFGGSQLHASLLGFNGKFEKWQRLTPSFNGYDSINQASISICHFDPGDDEIAPNNETMCNLAPVWAELGDIEGVDPTCVTDTDNNDPTHKDCGRLGSCSGGANCTSVGTTGTGVWARSAFNLSPFAGRVARFRWIHSSGGGWSFGTSRSFLEPNPGNPSYQYFDGDDGWFIDSIRLTDLRNTPATIEPDDNTGLFRCINDPNDPNQAVLITNNCGVAAADVAGSVAFGSLRLLGLDSLLQPISLDARRSTFADNPATTTIVEGACENGVLQAQWSQLDASGAVVDVIAPFSPAAEVKVAPSADTTYRVQVRCSIDPACAASQDVLVKVYSGEGSDLNQKLDLAGALVDGLHVIGGATATLQWQSRPQPTGITGYDVYRFTSGTGTGVDMFTGNTFDGTCFANAVANAALGVLSSTTDATIPAVGTTFMYQVSHSSNNVAAINPLGVRPPSSNRAGQLVMAGVTCP